MDTYGESMYSIRGWHPHDGSWSQIDIFRGDNPGMILQDMTLNMIL